MKHPRALVVALAGLAIALVGCTGIDSPDGWAGAVVAGDVVYVNDEGDDLLAMSRADQAELWRFPGDNDDIDIEAIYGEPAVGDGRVFISGYDGFLYALDAET
ncbi:MAG TPA: PQQ-binding-like beta-propeller repeat protein, partial [Dehalococcoidia bacterium]|nr:PQQ-binding-like beta-propeller repeat protein [Dehalococcoidia bacterium]